MLRGRMTPVQDVLIRVLHYFEPDEDAGFLNSPLLRACASLCGRGTRHMSRNQRARTSEDSRLPQGSVVIAALALILALGVTLIVKGLL